MREDHERKRAVLSATAPAHPNLLVDVRDDYVALNSFRTPTRVPEKYQIDFGDEDDLKNIDDEEEEIKVSAKRRLNL